MRDLFISISFIILISSCNKRLETDYIAYHKMINKAEQHIDNSGYDKALDIYQSLIEDYKHVFHKDLYNACICAIMLNKFDKAIEYTYSLVNYGYELKDFDENVFRELRKQSQWVSFIKDYPKLRKQYLELQNTEIRKRYLELRNNDIIATEETEGIEQKDSIYSKIATDIIIEIGKNGFQNFMYQNDSIFYQTYIMMRHICGFANNIIALEYQQNFEFTVLEKASIIKKISQKALNEGYLSPLAYVGITTYCAPNPYGEIGIKIDFKTEKVYYFFPDMEQSRISSINLQRDRIGLPSIDMNSINKLPLGKYKDYPFLQIKEKLKEELPSTHTTHDIMRIIIKSESLWLQEAEKSPFILNKYNSKSIYYVGI